MNLNHGHKVFCLMNTGKSLTPRICDVLLLNAYDMFFERCHRQRIKGSGYDGVIESDLEIVEHQDVPCIVFEALLSTDKWEVAEVKFFVRTDDFEGVNEGEWMRLVTRVMSGVPFENLPAMVQQAIEESGEGGEGDLFQVQTQQAVPLTNKEPE